MSAFLENCGRRDSSEESYEKDRRHEIMVRKQFLGFARNGKREEPTFFKKAFHFISHSLSLRWEENKLEKDEMRRIF